MMGLHNLFPHSQQPLRSYYDDLVNGNNSYMFNNQLPSSGAVPGPIQVGPWDDIMCWFAQAGVRRTPLDQGGEYGHKRFYEPNGFGRDFWRRNRG